MLEKMRKIAVEKILQAIQNQRWFFFENEEKVLLDGDTGLLWANLNYFPYEKSDGMGYSPENSYAEVKNLIKKINSEEQCYFKEILDSSAYWDSQSYYFGFMGMFPPTPEELWKLVEDRTFPFLEGTWFKIKNETCWCVYHENKLCCKNLNGSGENYGLNELNNVRVITRTIWSNENCDEQLIFTAKDYLYFFSTYQFIPIFDDSRITVLYKLIFIDKQLYKLISFPELLIEQFDTTAINKSVIKYSDAVISVTDELLEILQEYETAQAATIAEFLPISLKLNAKSKANPDLTPAEHVFLEGRRQFLAQRLDFGFEAVEAQINSVKTQAESLARQIDRINRGNDSISELAVLQNETRADFELLTENLAQIILNTQRRVDLFLQNKNFITNIVNTCAAWNDDYKAFKTNLRGDFNNICNAAGIDQKISGAWYDDWNKSRFAIEDRFSSLVEFVINGHFFNGIYDILGNFQRYKENVDKFYLEERINIYKKFAPAPDGDLQEKFETESALYKLAEKFNGGMQKIILLSEKMEGKNFLLRWADSFRKMPLDALSNFIRNREINTISEEALTQFAALKLQNFAAYPSDLKAFDAELQRREKEFDALISRMRSELHKS